MNAVKCNKGKSLPDGINPRPSMFIRGSIFDYFPCPPRRRRKSSGGKK
jgi:hypothetical protein